MNFEKPIVEALALAKTSKSVAVRQAATYGIYGIATRGDFAAEAAKINADPTIGPSEKRAAKLARAKDRLRELADGIKRLNAAKDEYAKNIPPIPVADSAGAASIDAELRAYVRSLSPEKLGTLNDAAKLAVARAPEVLSNIGTDMHKRLQDEARRKLFPERMAELDNDALVIEAVETALQAARETARANLDQGGNWPNAMRNIGAPELV